MPEPTLYGSMAAHYDRAYRAKDYRAEMRELLHRACSELGRAPRSHLDVACGTGRHLEACPRRLIRCGTDRSPEMLAIARGRLGPHARWVLGDVRSFRAGGPFDVLTCLFSAMGYLPNPRARERAFRNFYLHLAPGGVASIEGWIRPTHFLGRHTHVQVYDGTGAKVVRVSSGRRSGSWSIIEMQYLVGVPGRPIQHFTEEHRNPRVAPAQMLRELRRAGFRARVDFGGRSETRGPFVARRPPATGVAPSASGS